jgi:hypothetical protein
MAIKLTQQILDDFLLNLPLSAQYKYEKNEIDLPTVRYFYLDSDPNHSEQARFTFKVGPNLNGDIFQVKITLITSGDDIEILSVYFLTTIEEARSIWTYLESSGLERS